MGSKLYGKEVAMELFIGLDERVLSISYLLLPTHDAPISPRRHQPRPHRSSRSSTRARPAGWKSSVRHWTRRRRRISLLVPPLTELCTTSAATAAVFQPLFGGPIDIQGPPNTPYAGGAFLVFFDFPSKYPHESPRVRS